jgi:hypothetical protein
MQQCKAKIAAPPSLSFFTCKVFPTLFIFNLHPSN